MCKRNSTKLFAIFLITHMCTACSYFGVFNVPSIEGRVIDGKTKLPLDNVVIIVERPVVGGYHGSTAGHLPFQQALTDKNGLYTLPSLGIVSADDYIDSYTPNIYLFKAGYKWMQVSNYEGNRRKNDVTFPRISMHDARYTFNRSSVWNDRDIEMEQFEGTNKEYIESLQKAARLFDLSEYDTSYREGKKPKPDCNWVGIDTPLWYEMINREMKAYSTNDMGLVESSYQNYKNCSKWEQFFKAYSR